MFCLRELLRTDSRAKYDIRLTFVDICSHPYPPSILRRVLFSHAWKPSRCDLSQSLRLSSGIVLLNTHILIQVDTGQIWNTPSNLAITIYGISARNQLLSTLMAALHNYLFPLICTSLGISVASISFSALAITSSSVLWLIPAVVIITFIYHTLVLLVAHSETYTAPRIYSTSSIICAYLLTSLWMAVFVTSVTFTCLVLTKKWVVPNNNNKLHIWLILLSVLSFIEIMIMGFIAIISHKELILRRYKQKWEWKNGPAGWSTFVQLPT